MKLRTCHPPASSHKRERGLDNSDGGVMALVLGDKAFGKGCALVTASVSHGLNSSAGLSGSAQQTRGKPT
jgi:hypothetical protein